MGATGVVFRVVVAVAVIEGAQPCLGYPGSLWLLGCTLIWSRIQQRGRHSAEGPRSVMSAIALSAAIAVMLAETLYALALGGFVEPSTLF